MKVHFAGNSSGYPEALLRAGVRYRLQSFYNIVKGNIGDGIEVWNQFKHVIIDSGLFTMMFGSGKDEELTFDKALAWQEKYVQFILDTPFKNASFVELDVQKKLGPEAAWDLRRRFRRDVPDRYDVINVYHLEDGNPEKLIQYSDYIGVSQPELRLHAPQQREEITLHIARLAKKLGKKVHLLGLTESSYLKKFRFCDSCDSTSWQAAIRYGSLPTKEHGRVDIKRIRQKQVGEGAYAPNDIYYSAAFALNEYRAAGSQR